MNDIIFDDTKNENNKLIYVYSEDKDKRNKILKVINDSLLNTRLAVMINTKEFIDNKNILEDIKNNDIDTFIVDDIELLSNDYELQTLFFNTFNHLYTYDKKLILLSSLSPTKLIGFNKRLKARLSWGKVYCLDDI
ncbi:MAG: hypothetical protein E7164_01100 [Firmicutes bacterium]|nr:hypothetical protein [Bacillota bacterium]